MFAKRCQYYAQPLSPASWERLVHHKQLRGDHRSEIICTHVHMPCLLAAGTIRGWHLLLRIVRLLFKGGDYSRVATIRRNVVAVNTSEVISGGNGTNIITLYCTFSSSNC